MRDERRGLTNDERERRREGGEERVKDKGIVFFCLFV